MSQSRPIALTVAGSDSSGGAGIQADHKTFAAHGVYGASVLAALTAQNTTGVQAVHVVPASFVGQQLDSVFSDLSVTALKTGMLATSEIIGCVATRVAVARARGTRVVVDPVMVATSGDRLLAQDAVDAMRSALVPRSDLITPNIHEAAVLLDRDPARTQDELETQGRMLLDLGCGAVLMKGGHAHHEEAADCLVTRETVHWVTAPWVETPNTHGTGCTLSAAITAGLASGLELSMSVERAKAYLTLALQSAKDHQVGQGAGPPDHLVTAGC